MFTLSNKWRLSEHETFKNIPKNLWNASINKILQNYYMEFYGNLKLTSTSQTQITRSYSVSFFWTKQSIKLLSDIRSGEEQDCTALRQRRESRAVSVTTQRQGNYSHSSKSRPKTWQAWQKRHYSSYYCFCVFIITAFKWQVSSVNSFYGSLGFREKLCPPFFYTNSLNKNTHCTHGNLGLSHYKWSLCRC